MIQTRERKKPINEAKKSEKEKELKAKEQQKKRELIGINVEMNIENSIVIIANAIPNRFGVYL